MMLRRFLLQLYPRITSSTRSYSSFLLSWSCFVHFAFGPRGSMIRERHQSTLAFKCVAPCCVRIAVIPIVSFYHSLSAGHSTTQNCRDCIQRCQMQPAFSLQTRADNSLFVSAADAMRCVRLCLGHVRLSSLQYAEPCDSRLFVDCIS